MLKYKLWMLGALLINLTGCTSIGVHKLTHEQPDYQEAISKNTQEEMLINLVKLKYTDNISFLDMSSISTNHSLEFRAGYDLSLSNVIGNPLSAGHTQTNKYAPEVTYAEKPIINYTPLSGEKFTKKLLTPIPLYSIYLLTRSGWRIDQVFRLLVQEFNGIENATSSSAPTSSHVPEYKNFVQAVEALRELQINDALRFNYLKKPNSEVLVMHIKPGYVQSPAANALRKILHIPNAQSAITIGEYSAEQNVKTDILLESRSLLDCFYFLSNAVKVPQLHTDKGLVTVTRYADGTPFEWSKVTKGLMVIHSQTTKPNEAAVKVFYRNHWYYIADNDIASKSTLAVLCQLFELNIQVQRQASTQWSVAV